MAETRSTCCYCGVGCGVIIEHQAEHITGVRGDPDHPANFGRLCTKGSTLHLSAAPETLAARALHPQFRRAKEQPRQRVDWDWALDTAAARFAAVIRKHGPDAVAFYGAGQWLTEDYYVFNKLAKGLIGTNNIDTNSRLCMSSAVSGYKMTLGADAPPACYEDIDASRCLFISGSNTAFAHPIIFRRIEDARAAQPDLKLIVVDPRRTDTAEAADLHLPILPGTDIALYNAMLHVMLWEGWVERDYIETHTEGFDAVKRTVREYTPSMAATLCGVPRKGIERAAEWFARSPATLSMYCQGLNQYRFGSHNNAALINLHLATGQIGRPGAGPFSLTGQPNAMGGREVGGLATLLSAHRDLENAEHRAEVAALWGIDSVPETPGKSAVELFKAMDRGEIKALWIACTNPAQSMPDQTMVQRALQTTDFVVVQEAFANTETCAFADLLLPAASWGEKEGTVTNSERRISRVQAAVPPPGEARADWRIGLDFARRLGSALDEPERARRLFPYRNAEQVWNEHRESTRGRDVDITGLSYALLESRGPQQWPFPEGAIEGQARLYEDGHFATASGRARFVSCEHRVTSESPNSRFPLHLITGRLRDQWHGMSRTGNVARLYSHEAEAMLHMHADDLARRGIGDGDLIRIRSKHGGVAVKALASTTVRPGQCFLPMHWGGNSTGGLGVNALTAPICDPHSGQPELKHAAVEIEKLATGPSVVALRRTASDSTAAFVALRRLRPLLARFDYASLTLAGRDAPVVVLKLHGSNPSEAELGVIDAAMGLTHAEQVLSYQDSRRKVAKRARISDDRLTAIRLAGETRAADWLAGIITSGEPAGEFRPWLFAPLTQAPSGSSVRGKIVCNCFDIAERDIEAALQGGESLADLQQRTGCGTNCGSCTPELRRIAAARSHA